MVGAIIEAITGTVLTYILMTIAALTIISYAGNIVQGVAEVIMDKWMGRLIRGIFTIAAIPLFILMVHRWFEPIYMFFLHP